MFKINTFLNTGSAAFGPARRRTGRPISLLLGGAAASALLATSALAEAPPPPADASAAAVGEVIVTAEKRSERLIDVPAPVTALSQDDLARTEAVRLDDFAAQTPGLNLISDREGETQIVIRGITTGTPVNSTVATYVDDTPYGSSTNAALGGFLSPDLDPSDIQRIEVLRGPQGTLYGASSLGGVIKYVTVQPDLTKYSGHAEIDGSLVDGGGDGGGARLMANIPIVTDTLGLRISGYYRRDPGFIDNPHLGLSDLNDTIVDGGRASLLWEPLPTLSVNLTAVLQDLKGDGSSDEDVNLGSNGSLTPTEGDLEQVRYIKEPLDVRYRLYSATENWDLRWANLISVTSYSTQHQFAVADQTNQLGAALEGAFGLDDVGFNVNSDLTLHKTTQEFRLESPSTQQLEWRAGAYFTHEASLRNEPSGVFSTLDGSTIPLPGSVFFSTLDSRYTEYAGFGDLTYHFTSKFDLAAGLRYSHNDQHFTNTTGGLAIGPTSTLTQTSSDSSTTFMVTPRYQIDDDNMVYARVASGYRPGGPNSTSPAEVAEGVPTAYKPDTLTDYDIGYKAALFDHHLSLDVSAFYIDWRDIQIETLFNGITTSGNGGTASSTGFEATATLTPVKGLNLTADVAYTDAKLTQDAPGVNGKDGDELPNVPKWGWSLSADYDFPLTGKTAAFVGGSLRYVGDRESGFVTGSPTGFARPQLPSYTTVDLRTGLIYQRYTFEFYVKNVGDERGFNNIQSMNNNGYAAPYTASVIQPRTIGFSLGVKY